MKEKRLIIALTVFLTCGYAFGQSAPEVKEQARLLLVDLSKTTKNTVKTDIYMKLAVLYSANSMPEEALQAYQSGVDLKPPKYRGYEIYLAMGDISLGLSKYISAIDYYTMAVKLLPKKEEGRLKLAVAYDQSDLFDHARQEYLKILKINKKSFDANFNLASLYLRREHNTLALEYFRRALSIRADNEVYRRMSVCAEKLGEIDLAIGLINQVLTLEKKFEDYIRLGRLYEMADKPAEAEKVFSGAIEEYPDEPAGPLYLATFYFMEGRLEKSESLFKKVSENEDYRGVSHFFLSQICCRRGDLETARREISMAKQTAKSEILKSVSGKYEVYLESRGK